MDKRPGYRQDQSLVEIIRQIRDAPLTPPGPYSTPRPSYSGSQRQWSPTYQLVTRPAGFWWVWSAGSVLPFLGSLVGIESGNINLFTVVLLLVGIANIVLALLTEGYSIGGTGAVTARTFALITGWLGVIGFGLLCCIGAVYVLSFLAQSP